MKTKALGVFFAFLMARTAAFAQMGDGQGMGQGGMNHTNGWMGGGDVALDRDRRPGGGPAGRLD